MASISAGDVVAAAIKEIRKDSTLNHGIEALRPRKAEFADTTEMMLTGIAAVPAARALLDDRLERTWQRASLSRDESADEVVIGAGLHAAIYCAARVQMGFPKPLVLERERVGGAFAMSRRPSFYLNSRNRPGTLGLPGEDTALNYLPGALVQPANLSHSEYHSNADLAWIIRVTLAQHARIATGAEVNAVYAEGDSRNFKVMLQDGDEVFTDRVIDARGLGDAMLDAVTPGTTVDNRTIKTFSQLMASLDDDFPLRGMKRVAVVGGGDAGKCAVEALLGLGPSQHMSSAKLDFVQQIDWYAPGLPTDCEDWRNTQRGRYQSIGAYLRTREGSTNRARLRIHLKQGEVSQAFRGAYVDERLYDCAILATGWRRPTFDGTFAGSRGYVGEEVLIAMQYDGADAYAIGPAAEIPFSLSERRSTVGQFPANTDAIFRLAGRSAALAARLPGTAPF